MRLHEALRKVWLEIFARYSFFVDFICRRLPDQMVGRVFNLNTKRFVELDGFGLFVIPSDYIGRSILESKSYEPHVTKLIRNQLKLGDVFVDLGANIGYFTMLASSLVGEQGKVIAIEPNPHNLQLVYATCLKNGFRNIDFYPYAASDQPGILRFTTVGSNGGVVTEYSKYQKHYLLVPAIKMDILLNNLLRIDLIKIDVEAHEPAAVRGMSEIIRRTRPKIITEFHPWAMKLNNAEPPDAYLGQLTDLGYVLSIIEPSGALKAMSGSQQVMQYWRDLKVDTAHLDLFSQPKD